jgi:hypothetical protein
MLEGQRPNYERTNNMEVIGYIAKFLAGGALVCAFALVSDACKPKRFSGLFSAAPSVLLAGLVVTLVSHGATRAMLTAEGAVAGAVGMIVYCLVATPAIRRFKALLGSTVAMLIWFAVALGAFATLGLAVGW